MAVTKTLEAKTGPDGSLTGGRMSATVTYRMAGADVEAYILELLGGSTFLGGRITDTLPAHPDYNWLQLEGWTTVPVMDQGADDGQFTDVVRFTERYIGRIVGISVMIPEREFPVPTAPSGTWFSRAPTRSTTEFQTLPGQQYQWKTSGKAFDELDVGIQRSVKHHEITWHNIPAASVPWDAIRDAEGHVNKKVTSRFWVASWDANEVLLFSGYEWLPRYDEHGDLVYDITFRFIEKAIEIGGTIHSGWNKFYNSATKLWDEIHVVGDATAKVYPTEDFVPMLQFAPP
jgi:hypothetical protein